MKAALLRTSARILRTIAGFHGGWQDTVKRRTEAPVQPWPLFG
jgi:hypothetical protein